MSSQHSSYTSYSSTSYSSSSSSSNNGEPHRQSYTETAQYNSRDGGHITRESRETGQPTLSETRDVPVQGRVTSDGADSNRGIEDVTDKDQSARDQEYLDRMEDEYAKREGGA